MKITKSNNKPNFRQPSAYEVERISKNIRANVTRLIKISNTLSTIFSVFGLLMLGSIGNGTVTYVSIALGVLSFVLVFCLVNNKKNHKSEILGFEQGEFLIADGTISKIEINPDTPGCIKVCFVSMDGTFNDGWYNVRQEYVRVGTQVILIYPTTSRTQRLKPIVFTPFMMTDEALGLHW